MVLRPSSSQWSISPETIMSHHYRLARGIKSVVDTSPPYSMYNSPISVHYIPKRASSADCYKRNNRKVMSQPERDLSDFVNMNKKSLKLALPRTNSYNELAKPKLLGNRNYQPPLHRKKKPPLPPMSHEIPKETERVPRKPRESNVSKPTTRKKQLSPMNEKYFYFKNSVFDAIIERRVYSDKMIIDTVENEMRQWVNNLTWNELEYLKEEIYDDLGIRNPPVSNEIRKIQSHNDSSKSESKTSSYRSESDNSNNSSTTHSEQESRTTSSSTSEYSDSTSISEEEQ